MVATLVKTDPDATPGPPRHELPAGREGARRAACRAGLTIPPQLEKLGYKGVETTELVFADHRVPADEPARRRGGARVPADDVRHRGRPRERGRPRRRRRPARVRDRDPLRPGAGGVRPPDRQAPGHPVQAGRDGHEDRGRPPADALGGAARRTPASAPTSRPGWPSCSRPRSATRWSRTSLRIHGGYGYSKEYEIERLYRDAPLLLIGEGTSEIQKLIIARGLLARNPL